LAGCSPETANHRAWTTLQFETSDEKERVAEETSRSTRHLDTRQSVHFFCARLRTIDVGARNRKECRDAGATLQRKRVCRKNRTLCGMVQVGVTLPGKKLLSWFAAHDYAANSQLAVR
jgi:hypothetical protein